MDRRHVIRLAIEHDVVTVQILAEGVDGTCGHDDKQPEGLGGLGRAVEGAPTDARKSGQIGEDRSALLIEQIVEGRASIGFDQKGFDGFEAHLGAVGLLNPVKCFSRISSRDVSGDQRSRHLPAGFGRP